VDLIDKSQFDQALPTRMLANREALGLMGERALIEQDRVIGDLLCHVAEVWRDLSDISGLATSNL
jgi:hypothetical protein